MPKVKTCTHHTDTTSVHTTQILLLYTPHRYYFCTHHTDTTSVHTTQILLLYTPHRYYFCTHHTDTTSVHTTQILLLYTPHRYYFCTHHTDTTSVHTTHAQPHLTLPPNLPPHHLTYSSHHQTPHIPCCHNYYSGTYIDWLLFTVSNSH